MSLVEAAVLNTEEAQKKFLTRVHDVTEKWATKEGAYSVSERCHGVAHSLLSIIDGNTGGLPAFELTPVATDGPVGLRESDKHWPVDPLNATILLAPQYANTYDERRDSFMLAAVDLFD